VAPTAKSSPNKRPRKPESAKTVTARGAALKNRRHAMGLERVEVWVRPEDKAKIKELALHLTSDAQF
jgi:hypothetical protein